MCWCLSLCQSAFSFASRFVGFWTIIIFSSQISTGCKRVWKSRDLPVRSPSFRSSQGSRPVLHSSLCGQLQVVSKLDKTTTHPNRYIPKVYWTTDQCSWHSSPGGSDQGLSHRECGCNCLLSGNQKYFIKLLKIKSFLENCKWFLQKF